MRPELAGAQIDDTVANAEQTERAVELVNSFGAYFTRILHGAVSMAAAPATWTAHAGLPAADYP